MSGELENEHEGLFVDMGLILYFFVIFSRVESQFSWICFS